VVNEEESPSLLAGPSFRNVDNVFHKFKIVIAPTSDWLHLFTWIKLAYVISFPVFEDPQIRTEQKQTGNHGKAAENE
jgi:hypothetical protein